MVDERRDEPNHYSETTLRLDRPLNYVDGHKAPERLNDLQLDNKTTLKYPKTFSPMHWSRRNSICYYIIISTSEYITSVKYISSINTTTTSLPYNVKIAPRRSPIPSAHKFS